MDRYFLVFGGVLDFFFFVCVCVCVCLRGHFIHFFNLWGYFVLEKLFLHLIQNAQQKQQSRIYFIHER